MLPVGVGKSPPGSSPLFTGSQAANESAASAKAKNFVIFIALKNSFSY
jgi:hypothetical protein